MRPSRRLTCWGLLLGFVPAVSLGQVKTDGSLGARQTLAGPNFSIPNTLGRQVGPNLFHSFSDFNVRAGESATFSGPNTVNNVLARVTGGQKSAINGALRSDIPSANLYLINPAGVVFGPGAQLEVSGSFAVTTADVVHLRGGGRFAASTNTNASVLTTAPPAAFGFLRPTRPAGVSFNSSGLAVSQGKVLSVVAGDVRISPGVLGAEAGRINLVAAAPSSTVTLDPSSLEAPLTQDAASGRGRVQVGPDALVVTAGDGGSKISINAGRLDVVQSQIRTSINGDQPGIGMDVDVGALRIVNGQMFSTAEAGAGRGGDIRVNAASVLIQSTDPSLVIGIGADTTPLSTGNGGDVNITTGDLTMLGPGATIISGAVGRGDSGNVVITARRFLLDGQAAGGTMGVFSRTTFQDPDAGDAGDITVTARELILRSDAVIGTFSFSPGNSGTINIDAARMLIDGTSSEATGMASNAASTGNAGDVNVTAGELTLRTGGSFSSATLGPGNAGNINITADRFLMDGAGSDGLTGIDSTTQLPGAGGRAGDIVIDAAESLTLVNGAVMNSTTFGQGDAGTISIRAGELILRRGGHITSSTIAEGEAGNVSVEAGRILAAGESSSEFPSGITAISDGTGRGGSVNISTGLLTLIDGAGVSTSSDTAVAGDVVVRASEGIELFDRRTNVSSALDSVNETDDPENTQISAFSLEGSGGNITLITPGRVTLFNSLVTARAAGDGARITIDPATVALNRSVIDGRVGPQRIPVAVRIDQGARLITSPDSRILSQSIAAPPDIDLSGSLVRLNVDLGSADLTLEDACPRLVVGDVSTFTIIGVGAPPLAPGGLVPSLTLPPAQEERRPANDAERR